MESRHEFIKEETIEETKESVPCVNFVDREDLFAR
jgi:hypothetical protein